MNNPFEALEARLINIESILIDLKHPRPQPENAPENEFITRVEVCKLLNFNLTTLHKHTRSNKLKSYGIGNRVLYRKCEVLQAVKPIN